MSLFSTIMNKIFHPTAAAAEPPAQSGTPGQTGTPASGSAGTQQTSPASASPPPAAGGAAPQNVDVQQVLTDMAAKKGGGGNWQTSIVDLLKLLDMDSSLDARKQLAQELNVHAGADGSAEQNIALSKAVWQQLAQNGGQVPASLRD
ncbi:DUF3597 domain-containing protein [Roseomonas elaeocarpi]|uniref:DUF3597 domain-containing protein n=1 Tax=Roseomonas elaeocarpi TaxID=907779 RepID=A0ABV6JSL0_9PROT